MECLFARSRVCACVRVFARKLINNLRVFLAAADAAVVSLGVCRSRYILASKATNSVFVLLLLLVL